MLNIVSKSKYVVVLFLFLSILLVMFCNNDVELLTDNIISSRNDAPVECTGTLLSADESNQASEYYIANTTAKRKITTIRTRTGLLNRAFQKEVLSKLSTHAALFYSLACVLLVQTVIKYIYKADGKK